jgi:hypothetical protein
VRGGVGSFSFSSSSVGAVGGSLVSGFVEGPVGSVVVGTEVSGVSVAVGVCSVEVFSCESSLSFFESVLGRSCLGSGKARS